MNEKAKAFWEKAKEQLKKISKKVWIIAAVAIVIVAAVIAILLNNRDYVVLFTGLNREDLNQVTAFLEDQGVTSYRVEGNNTVLVASDQEPALKMKLLMADYPKSGYGYSTYYDNVGALATESERTTAYLFLLQERMQAAIRTLEGVQDAIVQLTPGTDRTYVLDSSNLVSAQAAVTVTMRSGYTLSKKQASAICNLVARSLQDLDVNNITILDSLGNRYSATGAVGDVDDTSAQKLQLEEEYNNRIRTRIMQVLIPLFGEENVRTEVNTTVDVNHTVSDSVDVFQPEWAKDGSTNGRGIIGSEIWSTTVVTGGEELPGGVVGSQVNSDLNEYVNNYITNGEETGLAGSGHIDYVNPTTTTHIERTSGVVTDCLVSITINSTTAGPVNLETIRDHAAMQAGITGEPEFIAAKVSVVSQPFFVRPSDDMPVQPILPIPTWALYAALGGLALFLILLILLLILRSKRKKKRRKEEEEQLALERQLQAMLPGAAAQAALAEPLGGADVMGIQTERSMELRREIRKFVDENPEIAAQMIRSLLRGGEENG